MISKTVLQKYKFQMFYKVRVRLKNTHRTQSILKSQIVLNNKFYTPRNHSGFYTIPYKVCKSVCTGMDEIKNHPFFGIF